VIRARGGARSFVAAALCLCALSACRRQAPDAAPPAQAHSTFDVTIGYQRSSWAFLLLRHQGQLDERLAPLGAKVKWLEFSAGPAIMEGISVGSLDVALVGDAPPVFAQAGGLRFAYAAVEPAKPAAAAIVVPAASPLRTVADLKGKKVGVQKGSSAHHLLIESLRAAGLAWGDVTPVYLAPPDARAAFEHGAIDGWAIWDPHYAAAELQLSARPLDNQQKSFSYRQFLIVRPDFPVAHREAYDQVIAALAGAERFIDDKPADVATLLASDAHVAPEILRRALARGAFGLHPITPDVWREQQSLADLFADLHLTGKIPDVRVAALAGSSLTALRP
jgi:sulfonate transport system substrate-binding protein